MSKSVAALTDEILSEYGLGVDQVVSEQVSTPGTNRMSYSVVPDIYADARALGIDTSVLFEEKQVLSESQKILLELSDKLFNKNLEMKTWVKNNLPQLEQLFSSLKEMTTAGAIGVNMAGPVTPIIPKTKKKTKKYTVSFKK